ncbi:FeoA family protein [Emticicia fontis]
MVKFSEKTVADLNIGEKGIITDFKDAAMSLKLLEMGCLPGTEVTLDFIAPLGCPVGIRVAGYHLSLRKREAATIVLKPNQG